MQAKVEQLEADHKNLIEDHKVIPAQQKRQKEMTGLKEELKTAKEVIKAKTEENRQLKTKLEELHEKASASIIMATNGFCTKKPSRDFTGLQLYSSSEQPSRIKGRNSANTIHRKLTVNKTSLDVYKKALNQFMERKDSLEHGPCSVKRSGGTSSTNHTDYNSASGRSSLRGGLANTHSGNNSNKTAHERVAVLGEIHKRSKSHSVSQSIVEEKVVEKLQGKSVMGRKLTKQFGLMNSASYHPKKSKENGAGLDVKSYKKIYVGNSKELRKKNLSVSFIGPNTNNMGEHREDRYGI
eukprot:TRINITY_DN71595_c0_g1_i1.p2 TRINITY_DN71595_c0_g1~~TRINITY_DN71595_c0_g1_i1.p2  ORF type:complete len:296 (-),score=33.51 TRINITY_DN71595_c0_g1_i1:162-1049(-)